MTRQGLPAAKTLALAFGFTNGNNRSDHNDEKGYVSYLYKNGSMLPAPRQSGRLGDWYSRSAYVVGLDTGEDRVKARFRDEFQANPTVKRRFTGQYLYPFNRRLPADQAAMEAEAVDLANQPNR